MVADWFAGKEIVTAFGVMLGAWPGGISLGLVSQSILATAYSWQSVMFLTAGICAIGFGVVTAMYRSPSSGQQIPLREAPTHLLIPRRELLPVSMAGLVNGNPSGGIPKAAGLQVYQAAKSWARKFRRGREAILQHCRSWALARGERTALLNGERPAGGRALVRKSPTGDPGGVRGPGHGSAGRGGPGGTILWHLGHAVPVRGAP